MQKNWPFCLRFEFCKQTIYSENKHKGFIYLIELFHDHVEFTTAFECIRTDEMNKCLFKFYISARKTEITTKKLP